ncbi:MAG: hypothetical protein H7Y38_01180, partial [Armatimonadetes bacterium]|nr:hypothetical protein [Armatimonadota bacterium]
MLDQRIERRDFLRRAGQGALLLATGALTGCGGGGSESPGVSRTPTAFEVRLVTGSVPAGRGRTSDDPSRWWDYRRGRIGRINNRGDVATGIVRQYDHSLYGDYDDIGAAALYRNGATTNAGVSVASGASSPYETVFDLNNRGQLLVQQSVFDSSGTESGTRQYLSENGVARPIDLPKQEYFPPFVSGINNLAHMVGSVSVAEVEYDANGNRISEAQNRAFVWRDGTFTTFG